MYDEEIPNETTLRAMREAERIVAVWRKLHAEPAHEQSAKKLYDDYGNVVTNSATLRALAESEKIIAAWRKLNDE